HSHSISAHYTVTNYIVPSSPTRRSSDLNMIGRSQHDGAAAQHRIERARGDNAAGAGKGIGGIVQIGWRRNVHIATPTDLNDATKDRKSTRLNSSHRTISYAVFCLKKKNK